MEKILNLIREGKLTSMQGRSGEVVQIGPNYLIFKSNVGRYSDGKYYPYFYKVAFNRVERETFNVPHGKKGDLLKCKRR